MLKLAQQLQHALLRLVGERQRGHRDRLAGRQRLAVGRFLVGIGQRQIRSAGLQHVDQALGKILADFDDREIRTEGRGFRAQGRAGGIELVENAGRRIGIQKIGAGGQRREAEARGVEFNTAGLSLAPLTAGTDFLDSNSATGILNQLNAASATLRSEASTLGSNLSIVEIRQDFSKSLINVLQTGASNLTLADTNEEAANSQALSTRQSIAVSALALANQSQASVLQLLR